MPRYNTACEYACIFYVGSFKYIAIATYNFQQLFEMLLHVTDNPMNFWHVCYTDHFDFGQIRATKTAYLDEQTSNSQATKSSECFLVQVRLDDLLGRIRKYTASTRFFDPKQFDRRSRLFDNKTISFVLSLFCSMVLLLIYYHIKI